MEALAEVDLETVCSSMNSSLSMHHRADDPKCKAGSVHTGLLQHFIYASLHYVQVNHLHLHHPHHQSQGQSSIIWVQRD